MCVALAESAASYVDATRVALLEFADHPFWELDNIIMVPHHSGATYGTASRRAQNLDRLTRGEALINIVHEISR